MDSYKFLPLLGRILLGAPFVMSGLGKLGAYSATVGYIAAVGLPVPPLAFILSVLIELGGHGGHAARLASAIMARYLKATPVSLPPTTG